MMLESAESGDLPLAPRQVIIGLSGGVDSAVSAALLQQAGYEPYAVVLQLWHTTPSASAASVEAALRAADALAIPCEVLDLRNRFYEQIVQPFAAAYAQGLTPNPCVLCNPTLKFAALLETADRLGARWIATGHYARVEHQSPGIARLYRAKADTKDQSYALHRLTPKVLQRLLLPLGEIENKERVRAIAAELRLPSAAQRDSQDLCFMAGADYTTLLHALRSDALLPGPILSEHGETLGAHDGIARFTVGQRSGLRISSPERLYVVAIDPARRAVIVGPRSSLLCSTCDLEAVSFCAGTPLASGFRTTAQVRYRAPRVESAVELLADRRAHVTFAQPQAGVAPGQSLVFYRDDEVLGGGIIRNPYEPDAWPQALNQPPTTAKEGT